MTPSQKLVHQVLALAKASDLELLEDPKLFCTVEEKSAAESIGELLRGYDYLASAEFEAACVGKSDGVIDALRRRMSSATAQSMKRLELYKAVREIRDSDRILALLPQSAKAKVMALRRDLDLVDGHFH